MITDAAPFPLDRPTTFTGIGLSITGDNEIAVSQPVGPRYLDHRGQTTIGSVGVLTDVSVGAAVAVARLHATGERPQSVMSQITASTAHPFPVTGAVSGRGRSVYFDDTTGLAEATLFDDDGNPVMHLTGRSIVVGRAPSDALRAPDVTHAAATGTEPGPCADPGVLAELGGLEIVAGIAAETVPRGPLAELLGLTLTAVEHGTVQGEIVPLAWMANPIASVHGGVLMSMAEIVSGLAAQTLTGVGGRYRLLQISADYLRSPAAPGPAVQIKSEVTRAGRRLASIETVICGADGTVYVRARANAQLFPGV
ncbi:PaaI family thioesterase [Rhodococcus sp. BL-253-APC-6A1W]|uniref:PaaI family thioesterase n=1 Tax=unclassified Rhodococcus (in: high G+C Gram-positive bacteria) TaxID=192944 RepID=UPI00146CDAD8|nr:PaaI family thioesterase [Rhodococcus sp. BL-253-APC-6A1W]NMD96766.1 PaaI family thioesterase [Rhodococcus sp. BL-253-APC-6A1W]